jgi:hypothetical protein
MWLFCEKSWKKLQFKYILFVNTYPLMYLSHIHLHSSVSFNTKEYRIFEEKTMAEAISWFPSWSHTFKTNLEWFYKVTNGLLILKRIVMLHFKYMETDLKYEYRSTVRFYYICILHSFYAAMQSILHSIFPYVILASKWKRGIQAIDI